MFMLVLPANVSGATVAEDWSPLWATASLSQGRSHLAGATIDGKVYFGGGYLGGESDSDVVDIYDLATKNWSVSHLSQARDTPAAAAVAGKVLFAGGYVFGLPFSGVVDTFDISTASRSTSTISPARSGIAGVSAGNKAFFAAGAITGGYTNRVDIYDGDTGTWSQANLSAARHAPAVATAGAKVVFAGGSSSAVTSAADIYDINLNLWSTATLSLARQDLAAAAANGKILFGGGASVSGPSDRVDIYDAATGVWKQSKLSLSRYDLEAAAAGSKVLFAGGYNSIQNWTSLVDIYDTRTGTWSKSNLSTNRWNMAGVSVGNKAFFAGGWSTQGGYTNRVDIYTSQEYAAIDSSSAFTLQDYTTVAGRMNLTSSASLDLGAWNLDVGSMSGDGSIDLSTRTLTVGSDNTDSAYGGRLYGSGQLVKVGGGALEVSAPDSLVISATVNGGTLSLVPNASLGGNVNVGAGAFLSLAADSAVSGAVTVNSGGSLEGVGVVSSATAKSGSHLSPGLSSVGVLHVTGNLSLNRGAVLEFDLGSASDRIALPNSILSLDGQQLSDFDFAPSDDFGPGVFTLIDAKTVTGNLGLQTEGYVGGFPATLSVANGDLVLTVVPEPGAWILAVMALVLCVASIRRLPLKRFANTGG